MYCHNCGERLDDGSNFCGNCGKSTEAAELAGVVPQASSEPKRGSIVKKIMIPVVTAGMVAIVVVIGLFLTGTLGPSLAVARAVDNFTSEFSQRLETTPVRAFPMLFDTLSYGTIAVDFSFEEGWEDWRTGDWVTSTGSGRIVAALDYRYRNSAAATVDGNIDGTHFDMSLFLDQNRAAFGSSLIGPNYYGITFDTFRNDFRAFAELIGLSNSEINEAADFVDNFAEMMRNHDHTDNPFSDYTAPLMRMLLASQQTDNRVNIRVAGQDMTMTRVQYRLTHQDIARLLHEWIDIIEADDNIRSALGGAFDNTFGNSAFAGILVMDSMYDMLIREMRQLVRDFEREMRGEITATFYIGDRNRLVRATLGGRFSGFADTIGFDLILDLGAHVNDTWRLSGRFFDGWFEDSFDIEWRIESSGGGHTHTWEIGWDDSWGGTRNSMALSSNWNPQSGHFTFDYHLQDRWGVESGELFGGNFVANDSGFVLRFDIQNQTRWSSTDLTLTITTQNSVDINKDISFVGIESWDQHFYDRVDDALWYLGW